LTGLVKNSFPKDGVVAAFVKAHYDPFLLNLDYATSFHEFAKQLFRRGGFKSMQLLGQPAVATVERHAQHGIQINIEPHLTGETIEVKEVDADTDWSKLRLTG
jgi:hypothetical protein